MPPTFEIAPQAKIPLLGLSRQERMELPKLFEPSGVQFAVRTETGNYVSRLGESKRVLWNWHPDASPTILSIVDKSYRAA